MLLFIWGRLRYDMVAILALLAALAHRHRHARPRLLRLLRRDRHHRRQRARGLAAIERSGVIEALIARARPEHATERAAQSPVLAGSVAILSAMVKNIGALAMLMPIAVQLARRTHGQPSRLLMPMSFAPARRARSPWSAPRPTSSSAGCASQIMAEPFRMFDFTPVGLGAHRRRASIFLGLRLSAAAGRGRAARRRWARRSTSPITSPRRACAEGSQAEGETIARLPRPTDCEVQVTAPVPRRGRAGRAPSRRGAARRRFLILEGEPAALERAISAAGLELDGQTAPRQRHAGRRYRRDRGGGRRHSPLAGGTAGAGCSLHESHGVNLIAVSRRGERLTERLRDIDPAGRRRHRPAGRRSTILPGAAARAGLPAARRAPAAARAASQAARCRSASWRVAMIATATGFCPGRGRLLRRRRADHAVGRIAAARGV